MLGLIGPELREEARARCLHTDSDHRNRHNGHGDLAANEVSDDI